MCSSVGLVISNKFLALKQNKCLFIFHYEPCARRALCGRKYLTSGISRLGK